MVIEKLNNVEIFDPLCRVCRAIAKDESRYFMNMLVVEEDWIVATDGRRIHFMPREKTGIEPGKYTVEKMIKSKLILEPVVNDDSIFPHWRRILPWTFARHLRWDSSSSFAVAEILQHARINHSYILDIRGPVYEVGFQESENKGVAFAEFGAVPFGALIMPFGDREKSKPVQADGSRIKEVFTPLMPEEKPGEEEEEE